MSTLTESNRRTAGSPVGRTGTLWMRTSPGAHRAHRSCRVGEGRDVDGVRLAHPAGGQHRTVEHHDHAAPRASALAATAIASRRLRGPSVSVDVGRRWAPVSTTGRASSWVRSRRIAVSSSVSVPWVTTTPSTSSRSSCFATASAMARRSASVIRYDPIRTTSCASTVMPASTSTPANSVEASSTATTDPPLLRDEMVPPLVRTTTCGTGAGSNRSK